MAGERLATAGRPRAAGRPGSARGPRGSRSARRRSAGAAHTGSRARSASATAASQPPLASMSAPATSTGFAAAREPLRERAHERRVGARRGRRPCASSGGATASSSTSARQSSIGIETNTGPLRRQRGEVGRARDRVRDVLGARRLVAPLHERVRHPRGVAVGQQRLQRHQRARLLARGDHQRRLVGLRVEDRAHRVADARRGVQVDDAPGARSPARSRRPSPPRRPPAGRARSGSPRGSRRASAARSSPGCRTPWSSAARAATRTSLRERWSWAAHSTGPRASRSLRRPVNRRDLKQRVRRVMQSAQAAATLPETSREQLLAVSEYARRLGGDIPGNGDAAPTSRCSSCGCSPRTARTACSPRSSAAAGAGAVLRRDRRGDGIETTARRSPTWPGGGGCSSRAATPGWTRCAASTTRSPRAADAGRWSRRRRSTTCRRRGRPGGAGRLLGRRRRERLTGSGARRSARPRVVVVEYTASLRARAAASYTATRAPWDGTDFYGASIDASSPSARRRATGSCTVT